MRVYLSGYYPIAIDKYESFDVWEAMWQMSEPEEGDKENWIWFEGSYNEEEVKDLIRKEREDADC